MSSSGTRPIFTLGLSPEEFHLPHPSVPLPVILVIHRVLLEAFALLREQGSLASLSEDEITGPERQESLKILELPRPAMGNQSAKGEPEPLHVSRHRRGFTWVAGKGTATDITIYHSWHCCD